MMNDPQGRCRLDGVCSHLIWIKMQKLIKFCSTEIDLIFLSDICLKILLVSLRILYHIHENRSTLK